MVERLLATFWGAGILPAWLFAVWAAVGQAHAGQSLFWLQTDGTTSQLGSVQNPQVTVATGQSALLYLWLDKDSISYGFDGISFDVRLIGSDGGQATAGISFDEPPGRWYGTSGGAARTDSGGQGVDDCNAIDLTNTDTLSADPLRLAALTVTGNAAGTVQLFLCIGSMGIADGGNNAVVWLGLANGSTAPDTQLINGGVPNLCSTIPEATITIVTPFTGDFDHDNDVDQEDFAHLQLCLTGSATPLTDPACADANLNGDAFVDDSDVAMFMACLSGPGATPPPQCH
ncbi:MAG: hypothetical protein HY718_04160 [Planctomycetes bacterium]|nr:hypothetical protein [Planctomycetota bacterium]